MHFRYTHFSTALPWNTYTRVGEFMTISQLVVSPHTKQSKKDAIRSGIVHVSRTDVRARIVRCILSYARTHEGRKAQGEFGTEKEWWIGSGSQEGVNRR